MSLKVVYSLIILFSVASLVVGIVADRISNKKKKMNKNTDYSKVLNIDSYADDDFVFKEATMVKEFSLISSEIETLEELTTKIELPKEVTQVIELLDMDEENVKPSFDKPIIISSSVLLDDGFKSFHN